jgi:low temperature requirement protein LtrA
MTSGAFALRRMTARRIDEQHRVATPLELLFDLTFVVAVSQIARELGNGIADDHSGDAIPAYLMVFFAIWWAWMNFTWFASAYDTDDVPYRLLTLVQMGGVLVLAAGVPGAFERRDFTAVTLGYVVMRVAMLAQWSRAARADLERRTTALRYVAGTALVQAGWLLRLALPDSWATWSFLVLLVAELLVPVWAERGSTATWHPHHIAERYGLFTIIVLGECVLAATTAVQVAVSEGGVSADLLVVAFGGLVLIFALWWLYFLRPAGVGLERRPELSFFWGYGHYGIFAGLAALGAGLEVTTEALTHHLEASDTLVAGAVAVPVAVVVLLVWALHAPLGTAPRSDAVFFLGAVVALLAIPALVAAGLRLPIAVVLLGLPVAALVVVGIRHDAGS